MKKVKPIISVGKKGKLTRADVRQSPTQLEKVEFVGRKTKAKLTDIKHRMDLNATHSRKS